MSEFNRAVINALLPPGPKWSPEQGRDFDLFLNGLADSFDSIIEYLQSLADLRNPSKTLQLDDLEREYGIFTKTTLTKTQRIENLIVKIYERGGSGSKDNLQTALQRAGFDVQVHENSPAVDPAIFLDQSFQVTTGDTVNGFTGDPLAYLGRIGGEILVNGSVFEQRPIYLSEVGNTTNGFTGDPLAYTGYFLELFQERQEYPIPIDPNSWPFIFFVGGDATRDLGTGELLNIEQASIPTAQKQEFENIILSIKPMHTWAGLIVSYI